ncbi:hypothetical protein Golomagni_08321 [Golovinomyces magnicellulatus]|nr:hypothetical protein Golomagni_08321 [Golovinomyces magnicellulatus]
MPIGFKNGTDGGLGVAVDAIRASSQPHAFMGSGCHRAHRRQRRSSHCPPRRLQGHQLRRRVGAVVQGAAQEGASGPPPVDHDRLLARQLEQGLPQPAQGGGRHRRAARAGRGCDHGRHDRVAPQRGQAGRAQERPDRPAQVRRLDHRRLRRLGDHRADARQAQRRRPQEARQQERLIVPLVCRNRIVSHCLLSFRVFESVLKPDLSDRWTRC